jgi:hypothetical protein
MFSQICTLNAPCARSGRRTEISLKAPNWKVQTAAKGKPMVFYAGDEKTREDENSKCHVILWNRILRTRYASRPSADPRMIAFLDENPLGGPKELELNGLNLDGKAGATDRQTLIKMLLGRECPGLDDPNNRYGLSRPISGLSLRGCSITERGSLRPLKEVWSKPSCILTHLDIGDNPALTVKDIKNLLGVLQFCFEFRRLGLGRLGLNDTGLATLTPNLVSMMDSKAPPVKNKFPCKLRWLDLSDNNISDTGFNDFHAAWSRSEGALTISGLTLNDNKLSDIAATVFSNTCRGVRVNFRLVHLQLQRNEIGDKGCEALAYAMRHHKDLLELDLTDNPISEHMEDRFMKLVSGDDMALAVAAPVTGHDNEAPPPLPGPPPRGVPGPPPRKSSEKKVPGPPPRKSQSEKKPPPPPKKRTPRASNSAEDDPGGAFTVADLLRQSQNIT